MVQGEWKSRGIENKKYRARSISHEVNTSIEYGEKTWTTAQTVRDVMQNHLDAETERYFRQVAGVIFDEQELELYFKKKNDADVVRKAQDLLHAAHLFGRHFEDMSVETRAQSEYYLQTLAQGLSIKKEVMQDGTFSPHLFLESIRDISEERPLVSFEIRDVQENKPLNWVSYETLASEPLYREGSNSVNISRYAIEGMKIVDHGSGFDSQLSALFISSKTDKAHLRGKFGEGAKMSELHLLRNGASIKMRSAYNATNSDQTEHNRTWQTKPSFQDGLLVSRGVEVEQAGKGDTGSMIYISLRDAKSSFKKDFIDNVDPRVGGLSNNIAEFSAHRFVYPMPITDKHPSGVNTSESGDTQFIQGLRVDLGSNAHGYMKPWFSYNFLDSSILGGRDRNEIKASIENKVRSFWYHADDPRLLRQLLHAAIQGECGGRRIVDTSAELIALKHILEAAGTFGEVEKSGNVDRIQPILADILPSLMNIEKGVPTLLIDPLDAQHDIIRYAENQGYNVQKMAHNIANDIKYFVRRRLPEYKVYSVEDVKDEMRNATKQHEREWQVSPEREHLIKTAFLAATEAVNRLAEAAGMSAKVFELKLKSLNGSSDEYDDANYSYSKIGQNSDISPVQIFAEEYEYNEQEDDYYLSDTVLVEIDSENIIDIWSDDARTTQRKIEAYIIGALSGVGTGSNKTEVLRNSQRTLDGLITQLLREDSPLLKAIPDSLEYEKDSAVMSRFMQSFLDTANTKCEQEKQEYHTYRRARGVRLTFVEAQQILEKSMKNNSEYATVDVLEQRIFADNGMVSYYDTRVKAWKTQELTTLYPVGEWNGLTVYRLDEDRLFIPVSMRDGAVLAKGEGKKREYLFADGDDFLHVGGTGITFAIYRGNVAAHPDGIILRIKGHDAHGILSDYSFYPAGTISRDGRMTEGISSTAIPIEYGKDEWDNPVRVFQDIIQNHIDASEKGQPLRLMYEAERNGTRSWVSNNELFDTDLITGWRVEDNGSGYFPNEIATMGATSKRSPLLAGKYGEGQKMVAAAALRNGFELVYESTIDNGDNKSSWSAKAMSSVRMVVLDGEEVEKKLVAFDVAQRERKTRTGSHSILRLPLEATPAQKDQWSAWIDIIDPRRKDGNGHAGLARYVRQLRAEGSELMSNVGSVSILLDEPGAVYENGVRINPGAEGGRNLAYGYDVPEIVTTRERNSYNHTRLMSYMRHALRYTVDPMTIDDLLRKTVGGDTKPEFELEGPFRADNPTAAPIWAEHAQECWPGKLVHSSQKLEEDLRGGMYFDEDYAKISQEAQRLKANMVHVDKGTILDVSENVYEGLSLLMPTVEQAVAKMQTVVLPVSPHILGLLSGIVAESTKTFVSMYEAAQKSLTEDQLQSYSIPTAGVARFNAKVQEWTDASGIETRNAIAVAPFDSVYHGKVDSSRRVIVNEVLLFEGNRRNLAQTLIHEMAHLISDKKDYTEGFVRLLYDLAQYLASMKVTDVGKGD